MASAPFAARETRLNRAVFSHLTNALAVVDGVADVACIFDNAYALGSVGMLGMASSQPVIQLQTSLVPMSPVGKAVTVNSGSYLIAAHEPDGTGISRLLLESAA